VNLRVLASTALAVLALTSCGSEAPPGSQDVPAGGAESAPASSAADTPLPWAVEIPKLGVRSTLIPLGLTEARELEVPPVTDPMQAGYYAGERRSEVGDEVLPGQVGSAVIAGHVDGIVDGRKGQPGIFHRLHELTPGDEVLVEQADGNTLRFVVTAVQRYAKDAFPSARVYERNDKPRLNLITCGGEFDRSSGHYRDNVVVETELAT